MTENNPLYSKKLCMSELRVSHTHYGSAHYYDAGAGKLHSSFGFLVRGEGTLSSAGKTIRLHEGDLFFIPEGIRYHSVWHGQPDVEFYTFEIISRRPDDSTPSYAMAHIPALSNAETEACFAEIYRLFATDERIEKIKALARYYDFYAKVLPHLSPEPPLAQNSALNSALDYIEQHAQLDFDVAALAAHCCVSESRLYHIFKSRLGTTPVRYRNEIRVENAAHYLRTTDSSIDRIAELCGFHSAAYFRETFREFTGLTPTEYRSMANK